MESVVHVVVFSELSPKSKVQYTRLLLDSNAKFVKSASDGKYTANIRLQTPRAHHSPATSKACNTSAAIPCAIAEAQHQSMPETACEAPPQSDPRLAGIPQALHKFANLIFLIGERKPVSRSDGGGRFVKETRLVRLINEIYDARYDDMSVANSSSRNYYTGSEDAQDKPNGSSSTPRSSSSNAFCRFIKHYLTNRFGLKKLVDQQAWELIDGLNSLQHRVDVELFASFVQGHYSEATLMFLLFARAKIQHVLSTSVYRPTLRRSTSASSERKLKKSASTSAVTTPVWLSKVQVELLAQTIFGSKKTEDACLQFMVAMKAFLQSQPSSEGRTPVKLVEANELLYIATETYHKYSAAAADVTVAPDASGGTQSMSMNATQSPTHNEGENVDGDNNNSSLASSQQQYHHHQSAAVSPAPRLHCNAASPSSSTWNREAISGKKGKNDAVATAASAAPGSDPQDVQRRFGSLLERMKQRQQSNPFE